MKLYAISDTHNKLDWIWKIPKDADFVLHAGDLTDLGSEYEYETIVKELNKLDKPVLLVGGNHDTCLQYNKDFVDQLEAKYPNVRIGYKPMVFTLQLGSVCKTVFTNPYVTDYNSGWGFGLYYDEHWHVKYQAPANTDIFLCHSPPSHPDLSYSDGGLVDFGNPALAEQLKEGIGTLVLCGHRHLNYISHARIANADVYNVSACGLLLEYDSHSENSTGFIWKGEKTWKT
jgi:Icc-related predicted phosphoesterase